MDIKIYSSFYKKYFIYKSNIIEPVFVGAALGQNDLNIIGDDTGDNISKKNGTFNELTLIYWVWKNTHSQDYVGFCHYRRYFVNRGMNKIEKLANLFIPDSESRKINKLSRLLTRFDTDAESQLKGYDIALPKPIVMNRTLREQYSDYHDIAHYDEMGKVIKELFPQFWPAFEDASERNAFFIANMFIFSRKYFDQFCEFVFPILFELEKRLTIPADPYQKRVFGYLGERLVTIFVNHISRTDSIKIKYFELLNTDVILSNYKSYLTEKKLIKGKSKNIITFGTLDALTKKPSGFYHLNGWVVIKDKSSFNHKSQIELYNDTHSYLLNSECQTRQDVTRHYSYIEKKYVNYDNCGFSTMFNVEEIKPGDYKVKVHVYDKKDDNKFIYFVYNCYVRIDGKNTKLVRLP